MATRTISNTGGNYNVVGTWVEGIVPTSADAVVATATSGQLTVNVSSAASNFNFTNYTNTLTVNAQWAISGAALTSTFVSAMTIVQIANIVINSSHSIVTNGKVIPRLALGIGGGTKTFVDELTVSDVFSSSTNVIMLGATVSISAPTCTFSGQLSGSTIKVVFNPTSPMNLITSSAGVSGFTVPIIIDASSTITISTGSVLNFTTNTSQIPGIKYVSGTFSSPPTIFLNTVTGTINATYSLDTNSLQVGELYIDNRIHTGSKLSVNLDSNFNFTTMTLTTLGGQTTGLNTATAITRISGSGRLIGGSILTTRLQLIATDGLNYTITPKLELSSGPTHSIEQLYISGVELPGLGRRLVEISSFTASVDSYLSITGTHSIISASFSDINASLGNPVSTFRTNLTGTTNITNYNSLTGGGTASSGGSWTFIN